MAFLPCTSCRRHVSDVEELCPFCGHARVAGEVTATQARPQSRIPRGSLFAFASIASISIGSVACSSSETTSNPPGPTVDSGVAADTAIASDTAVTDTGSARLDTGAADTGSARDTAVADTATAPDTKPTDDDGGAAPLYGVPPMPE